MTTRTLSRSLVAALCAIGAIGLTAQDAAGQSLRLATSNDSKLWIEGSSNVHGWSCKATSFDAEINVAAAFAQQSKGGGALAEMLPELQRVEVKVPVTNLKCGHGGMDKNMYKALKADATPDIRYILGRFDVDRGAQADAGTLRTTGTLSIAGTENRVAMNVVALRRPDGSIRATGELPLLMTDYGINPPTALLGTLKTGNQVVVKFDLVVSAQTVLAAMSANGTP